MSEGIPRAITRAAAWWALSFGIYLILISSVTIAEVIVGAALATVCTFVAIGVRRAVRPSSQLPRFEWRALLWLPLDIVRDLRDLAAYLVRYPFPAKRVSGSASTVPVERVPGADAESRRAYAAFVVSLSPGGYVVDVELTDSGPDLLHVHQLGRPGRAIQAVRS